MWHLLRHAQTTFRFFKSARPLLEFPVFFSVDISGTLSELVDGISDANVTSYR